MRWRLWDIFHRRKERISDNIDPDIIFLDAHNLPKFDTDQFEGRLEKPISNFSLSFLTTFFLIIVLAYAVKLWDLQINNGLTYLETSEGNRLKHTLIFAERGVIYDREGQKIAWNTLNTEQEEFPMREYLSPGFSHIVGHVKYPAKDKSGIYYEENFIGVDGVEKIYQKILGGTNGIRLSEIDAMGRIYSKSTVKLAEKGENVRLSIDAGLQSKLYSLVEETSKNSGYVGGAGVIMDVNNGEILAIVSYPEYDQEVFALGKDSEVINKNLQDKKNVFLNRVVSGLYTPGSIIKPFVASGVLEEKIIDPSKKILSKEKIIIPNPYFPSLPSVFRDWKAHGLVDFRRAIAVSSNIYFYSVGGGYGGQKGLGISKIEKYVKIFGFGSPTGIDAEGEVEGVIPSPTWKARVFKGEPWRLGDTYNSAIGQYGFQVTVIQSVRAFAALSNGGYLVKPTTILKINDNTPKQKISISSSTMQIVGEGMRLAVTDGTAVNLNVPYLKVAAKTGTAQVGSVNERINSWITGFFPYDKPRYAFVVVMDRGPKDNSVGGLYVMRQLLDWMNVNRPNYIR